MYHKDSLVYDQFNYDNHLKVRLGYILKNPSNKLLAQVLPFKKNDHIYVEDWMNESKGKDWAKARLRHITLTPVYRFELLIK